jgi:prepilin-type N-terminal cleavage/methylation domain-containing protein
MLKTNLHVSSHTYLKMRGFTLLEILISIGVLATVSTLIAQVLFTTTHVNKKTETLRDIKQNGEFTIDVIERLVRNANRLETVCDVDSVSTPAAIVRGADDRTTTLQCVSDGTVARIASVSATGSVSYLSGGNVTLSQSGGKSCDDSTLAFSCPPTTAIDEPMTVNFSLTSPGASISAFEKSTTSFQTTVSLRN